MTDDIQINGKWYHGRKRFKAKSDAQKYAAGLKRKGYYLQGDFYPPGTGSIRVIQKSDYIAYTGRVKKRAKYWFVFTGE